MDVEDLIRGPEIGMTRVQTPPVQAVQAQVLPAVQAQVLPAVQAQVLPVVQVVQVNFYNTD